MTAREDDADIVAAREFIEMRLFPLLAELERDSVLSEFEVAVVGLCGAIEHACSLGFTWDLLQQVTRDGWEKFHSECGPTIGLVHEPPAGTQ